MNDNLEDMCFVKAVKMVESGMVKLTDEMDIFQLTDLLIKLEEEKTYKNSKSDQNIDYNDEIVSIEDVGVLETADISVSGDNLFYCNGILTKNSFGLPATADFMIGLIVTDQLQELGQVMVKQLKNRYNDIGKHKRFVVGVDRERMKLYDTEQNAQDDIVDDTPVMSKTDFGSRYEEESKPKSKFDRSRFSEFK